MGWIVTKGRSAVKKEGASRLCLDCQIRLLIVHQLNLLATADVSEVGAEMSPADTVFAKTQQGAVN